MAGQLIRECIDNTRSKPTARLVLLVLAERANGNRYCWPSIATIAKDTGLTERSATRALNELRSLGEIHSQRIARRRTLGYLVTLGLTEEQIIERLTADPFNVKPGEAAQIAKNLVTLRGETQATPKPVSKKRSPLTESHLTVSQVTESQVTESHPDPRQRVTHTPDRESPPYEPSLEPSYEPEDSNAVFVPQTALRETTSNGAKNGNGHSKPRKEKPSPVPPPPPKPHIAIIDAWHGAIPDSIRPPGPPVYERNVKVAKSLTEAGITPEQVTEFVSETYPSYRDWARRNSRPAVMTLEHVKHYIKDWLAKQEKPAAEDVNTLDINHWLKQPTIPEWKFKT